jgi:hypothetical protein
LFRSSTLTLDGYRFKNFSVPLLAFFFSMIFHYLADIVRNAKISKQKY